MTEMPSETDVAIVGAGPAGLSLAIALRQQGASPILLEKRTVTENTSRAGVIHARTLEMLDSLKVAGTLLAQGIRVPTFRVRERGRILLEIGFEGLDTAYPFALMCPQDRTEKALRERFAEVGGTIFRGAEVTGVERLDDGALLTVKTENGVHSLMTRWVVACDGAHSFIREASGIGFQGGVYDQTFALADVRMNWPLARDEVTLFLSPEGLMVVGPLPDDRFRIVATVDHSPDHPDKTCMEPLLASRGPQQGEAAIREVLWSSRFTVAHRIADAVVKGRTILCGDAAHVHSPAGGQGMNTGIQDAISLAAPLLEALRSGDTGKLEGWAAERHRIAEDVVTVTDRITRAATLQSRFGRLARNTVLRVAGHVPGVPAMIATKLAELDRR